MRIVIADDSATARMFIRRCLEIAGYGDAEYVEAENGNQALEALRAKPTALLVSDLNMPELDGLALLKRISASPKLNGIPILMITSAGNPAKETELLEAGAKAVLAKPVAPPAIMEALEMFDLEEER